MHLRSLAQAFTTDGRLSGCGWRKVTRGPVQVVDRDGVIVVRGVMQCGLGWLCAVCSGRKRRKLAEDLIRAFVAWTMAGGTLVHVTIALPFRSRHSLDVTLDWLLDAFKALQTGHAQQQFRDTWAIRHYVRVLEVKYRYPNRWNPHLHLAFLLEHPLSEEQRRDMERDITERIMGRLDRRHPGAMKTRTRRHAVLCQAVENPATLARYLAKPQRTMTADEDDALTPFDALLDMDKHRQGGRCDECPTEGSPAPCRRNRALHRMWREYVAVIQRHRSVAFSNSLSVEIARLREAEGCHPDASDVGTLVRLLSGEEWDLLRRGTRGDPVRVLRQSALRGAHGITALVESHRQSDTSVAGATPVAPLPRAHRGRRLVRLIGTVANALRPTVTALGSVVRRRPVETSHQSARVKRQTAAGRGQPSPHELMAERRNAGRRPPTRTDDTSSDRLVLGATRLDDAA